MSEQHMLIPSHVLLIYWYDSYGRPMTGWKSLSFLLIHDHGIDKNGNICMLSSSMRYLCPFSHPELYKDCGETTTKTLVSG